MSKKSFLHRMAAILLAVSMLAGSFAGAVESAQVPAAANAKAGLSYPGQGATKTISFIQGLVQGDKIDSFTNYTAGKNEDWAYVDSSYNSSSGHGNFYLGNHALWNGSRMGSASNQSAGNDGAVRFEDYV